MPRQLENGVFLLSKAVCNPDLFMASLTRLDWVRHPKVPRCEYYYNLGGFPYTYGKKDFARKYESQPHDGLCLQLLHKIAEQVGHCTFDTCFLNRYLDQSDSLGWHSDDSPEMNDEMPIVILTLGAEREIWFREKPTEDNISPEPLKVLLPHGSACVMPPGFQDTHQHRIPRADRTVGERISLTYRGYVGS